MGYLTGKKKNFKAMKTLRKLSFAMIIALAFASCGSEKQMANNQPTNNQQNGSHRQKREIPCYKESRSDPNYFRELGVGTSVNEGSAKLAALENAKELMNRRLGGLVKGVSDDYSRTLSGQAPADKVQRIVESGFHTVIEKMLNDADNPCEDAYDEEGNKITYYYVIEISKQELKKQVSDVLSKNEELETLYQRQKFFDAYEKELKEISNNE